jgi:hypothetical protein
MPVRLEDRNSKPIPLQRGVREDDFKTLNRRRLGINIKDEYITHLRFAENIVVLAEII